MLHSSSVFERFMVSFNSVINKAHCNTFLTVSTTMKIQQVLF